MKALLFTAMVSVFFSISAQASQECLSKHSALYEKCTAVRGTVAAELKGTTGKELTQGMEESDLHEAQWDVFGMCAPLTEKLNVTQLIRLEEMNKSCLNDGDSPSKTLGEQNWCALENLETVLKSQCDLPL